MKKVLIPFLMSAGLAACGSESGDSTIAAPPPPAPVQPAPVQPAPVQPAPPPLAPVQPAPVKPAPAPTAPVQPAPAPAPAPKPAAPAASPVLFERTVNLKQRTTEQYEFEVKAPCTMQVEVKPDATTYITLASPTGSLLLNEQKVKSGTSLNLEVKAEKAGKYTLRMKNSNLFATKTVSVRITAK